MYNTETAKKQTEEMKKQTFGVEIEMTNITRHEAAEVAARYFGTDKYEYTASRNGYKTWSAWDKDGREWKFPYDASIDASDDYQCELNSPVLRYEDIELLQGLVRALRKHGAKSYGSLECGVHIHVGLEGHNAKTLRTLANLMASHEALIADALQLNNERLRRWCRMINRDFLNEVNRVKPTTMARLENIWYNMQGASWNRTVHYNSSRYHMLNLHSVFRNGNLEFRCFQFDEPGDGKLGGLHAGQLKAYIQFCLALSNLAKTAKCATPKPQQTENPKYAMRTWLIRLGLVGDEFSTARKFLTKNLKGDGAHRNTGIEAA